MRSSKSSFQIRKISKICDYFQIFWCRSIGAIKIIWTISHTFSTSVVTSAWIVFATIVKNSDIKFGRKISNGCRETAGHFIKSIVCGLDAKCQFIGFIFLFNIVASTRERWNEVSESNLTFWLRSYLNIRDFNWFFNLITVSSYSHCYCHTYTVKDRLGIKLAMHFCYACHFHRKIQMSAHTLPNTHQCVQFSLLD